MSEMTVKEKTVGFARRSYVKVVALAATAGTFVVTSASAVDLNASVGPILDSMIELIPTIINLIVAIVPAIIIMAVVGFIVTFFDRVLGMLKI